jgi:hypothetical protein
MQHHCFFLSTLGAVLPRSLEQPNPPQRAPFQPFQGAEDLRLIVGEVAQRPFVSKP